MGQRPDGAQEPDRVFRKQVLLECFLPLGCGGSAAFITFGQGQLQRAMGGNPPTGGDRPSFPVCGVYPWAGVRA